MGVDIYKADSSYSWDKAIEKNPNLNNELCVIAPEGIIVQGKDFDGSFKGIPHINDYMDRNIQYDVVDNHDSVGLSPRESLVGDNIITIHWNDNLPSSNLEVFGNVADMITSQFAPILWDRVSTYMWNLDELDLRYGKYKGTILGAQQDGQQVTITLDCPPDQYYTIRHNFLPGRTAVLIGDFNDELGSFPIMNMLTVENCQENDNHTVTISGILPDGDTLIEDPFKYHLSFMINVDGTDGDIMVEIPPIFIGSRNDGPDHWVYLSLVETSYTKYLTCGIYLSMMPLMSMSTSTLQNPPDYIKKVLNSNEAFGSEGNFASLFSISPNMPYHPAYADGPITEYLGNLGATIFRPLSLQDYMSLYWVLVAETGKFKAPNEALGYYQYQFSPTSLLAAFKPNMGTEVVEVGGTLHYRWHGILDLFRGFPILLDGGACFFNPNVFDLMPLGNDWVTAINPIAAPLYLFESEDYAHDVDEFTKWISDYESSFTSVFTSLAQTYTDSMTTARVSSSGLLIPTDCGQNTPINAYNMGTQVGMFTFPLSEDDTNRFNYRFIIANPAYNADSYYDGGIRLGFAYPNGSIAVNSVDERHSIYPLVFGVY